MKKIFVCIIRVLNIYYSGNKFILYKLQIYFIFNYYYSPFLFILIINKKNYKLFISIIKSNNSLDINLKIKHIGKK